MKIGEAIEVAREKPGSFIRRYSWSSRQRSVEVRDGENFAEVSKEEGKMRRTFWTPTYDDLTADDWGAYHPCCTRAPYLEQSTWRDPIQGCVEEVRIVIELDGDGYFELTKTKEWKAVLAHYREIESRHNRKYQKIPEGSEGTASYDPYPSEYFPWEKGAPSPGEIKAARRRSRRSSGS